jgi:ankyrin repeat protein
MNQNGESALMYAATNGHLACLTYLADKGANIETKNYVSRVFDSYLSVFFIYFGAYNVIGENISDYFTLLLTVFCWVIVSSIKHISLTK